MNWLNDTIEIWKPIVGWENIYEVSNKGRVKSCVRKHYKSNYPFKSPSKSFDGYLFVCLSVNDKSKIYRVHRLVASAFNENPLNLPEVNHKDGDKENNNDWNLEWCTHQHNMTHAGMNGLLNGKKGIDNNKAKLTESQVIEIRKNTGKKTNTELSKQYGVCLTTIQRIIDGKLWKHLKQSA